MEKYETLKTRDAAWLTEQSHHVVAVEPSDASSRSETTASMTSATAAAQVVHINEDPNLQTDRCQNQEAAFWCWD